MPETQQEKQAVRKRLASVEQQMRVQLRTPDPAVRAVLLQAMGKGGKRIRARVTWLAAQVCGQVNRQVEQLAASLELFHLATLIHDDVIDHASQRRHRPTLSARFGNATAVVVGDLIFTQVIQFLIRRQPSSVQQLLADAATQVCAGELQELRHQNNWAMPAAVYWAIIDRKTASLFAASTRGGALLAGANQTMAAQLEEYGRAYGLAFQIQDDLIDWTGNTRETGKPVGADIQEGRVTLPVIYGLRRCQGRQARQLSRALRTGDGATAATLLQACGALEQTRASGQRLIRRAENALAALKPSAARDELVDLARAALDRAY